MAIKFDWLLGKLRQEDTPASFPGGSVTYDNGTSGLTATDVQAAIDEIDNTMDNYRFKKRIGTWDPADPFPGGSGVESGHYWVVDTPGTRDGVVFTLEDKLVALVDDPSTTTFAGNWEKEDDKDEVTEAPNDGKQYARKSLGWEEVSAGGTDIQNTIFVTDNGDNVADRVDVVGNMSTPVTIERASAIATSGDLIYVFKGNYTITGTTELTVSGVNHYFEQGAVVSKATSGYLFARQASLISDGHVYGNGQFYCSGSASILFYNVKALDCIFEFDIAENTNSGVYWSTAVCSDTIIGKTRMLSTASITLNTYYGNTLVKCPLVKSTGGSAIFRRSSTQATYYCGIIESTAALGFDGDSSTTSNTLINATYLSSANCRKAVLNVARVDTLTGYDITLTGTVDIFTCNGGINKVGEVDRFSTSATAIGSIETRLSNEAINYFVLNSTSRFEATIKASQRLTLYNNQPRTISVTGSGAILNLEGHWHWYNLTILQTDGRVNMNGNIRRAVISSSGYTIRQTGGILNMTGSIDMTDVTSKGSVGFEPVSAIKKEGGTLILNGATITTNNTAQQAVLVTGVTAQDVMIYTGGVNTNKVNFLGIEKQRFKYTSTALTSSQRFKINGVGFTPTNLVSNATIAQDLSDQINASVDVNIDGVVTASQDTAGVDDYLYIEADVAGVEITATNFIDGTAENIITHTAGLTNLTGGVVIENANITA